MTKRRFTLHAVLAALAALLVPGGLKQIAFGATMAGSPTASAAIVQPVDGGKLVEIAASTHPLAIAKYDEGAVPDGLPMEHIFLQLRRSPAQEETFTNFIGDLQNPHAPSYHQWLTAEQIGKTFGPSEQDINTVVNWLESHGLQVNSVYKAGLTIDFSATAGQIRDTFHTEIHSYNINGVHHIANARNPQIPAALSSVLVGFVALHDFTPKPAMRKPMNNFSFPCTKCPDGFAGFEQYDEAPPDFATIYNVSPLYSAKTPITGKGQRVVVLEVTVINPADVATFRSAFGLS